MDATVQLKSIRKQSLLGGSSPPSLSGSHRQERPLRLGQVSI